MQNTSPARLIVAASFIPILLGLLIAAFAWPNLNLAPRDLPLGLVGPAPVISALSTQLNAHSPNAFDFTTYTSEDDARTAIMQRDIDGALVLSQSGTTLLVASAESAVVAQLLTQALGAAASAPGSGGQPVQVVDVVPAAAKDPNGLGLASSVLPLVIIGLITGIILAVLSRPGLAQGLTLAGIAIVSGVIADAIVQGWLGALNGDWWANAGVFALLIFAIASTVAGTGALFGLGGVGGCVLLMVFLGNSFSGISSSPVLLPKAIAITGQLLPPGAAGNLLRSTAFFGGNGAVGSLLVLCAWSVIGITAIVVGAVRKSSLASSIAALLGNVTARPQSPTTGAQDLGGTVAPGV